MRNLRRLFVGFSLVFLGFARGQVSYAYDELGRLISVVAPNGESATYKYDAVGNLLSITRTGSAQVSIAGFTPVSGLVGANVTISGSGFSATVSQNTVTFNGVTAGVVSAIATQIVATVPAGATTGPISVTTPNGTATSADSFVVTTAPDAPTIVSFSPTIGTLGTAVTVTGTNFDLNPANNLVKFNGSAAQVYSATSTALGTSVNASSTSGRISVQTPSGTATSSQDFFVVPQGYSVSSFASTARLATSTPGTSALASDQNAMFVFDGTAGQRVNLLVNSLLSQAQIKIYSPDGTLLTSATAGSGATNLALPTLPATGTYSILVSSLGNSGTITVCVTPALNSNDFSLLALTNPPQTNTSNPTYAVYVSGGSGFGGSVSLSVSGLPTGASATFNPTSVTGSGASTLNVATSPTTPAGTYTLTITGTSGALTHTTTATLGVNPIPTPWQQQDIGTVGIAGRAEYSGGTFTIAGSGTGIQGFGDLFRFMYQPLSADGIIVARITSIANATTWSKVGLMIRETLASNSTNAFMTIWNSPPNQGFQSRTTTGGNTNFGGFVNPVTLPCWVRLVRQGSNFSGYTSIDGVTWTQIESTASISMASSAFVGLAVSSANNSSITTAKFDNVTVTTGTNFVLTATPASQTIRAGASTTYTVGLIALGGFNKKTTLSASGLPAGATASFSPTTITGTGSSTLTVTTAANTPIGSYGLTITGTSMTLTRTTPATLIIGVPDFTVSASPTSRTTAIGTSTTYTVTTTALYGFTGTVSLSATGLPPGSTASFAPASVAVGGSSTFTVNVGTNTPGGAYTLTIAGTSGSLIRSKTVSLTVSAPNFSLSASPAWLTVPYAGGSNSQVITVTALNGFNKTLDLSVTGAPTGATATLSPTSLTGGGTTTLTVTNTGGIASGSYNLTVTATSPDPLSGNPTRTLVIALIIDANTGALPAPWASQDLGSVGIAGSSGFSNGAYTLQGSGTDIWSTADAFRFVSQPLSGDGTILARVVSIQNAFTYSKAGIMVRETLTNGSTNAFMAFYGPSAERDFQTRATTGGNTTQTTASGVQLPYWMKLVRQANVFTGYVSNDGAHWVQIGAATTISMAASVSVGLAVSAVNNSAVTTATFDSVIVSNIPDFSLTAQPVSRTAVANGATSYYRVNADALNGFTGTVNFAVAGLPGGATGSFSAASITPTDASLLRVDTTSGTPAGGHTLTITGTSGGLTRQTTVTLTVSTSGSTSVPDGWLAEDIGPVGLAGSASYSAATFTVQGSGTGIGGSADAFQFAYRSVRGNATIIARVASIQNPSNLSKAGIMIREASAGDSTNVLVALQGANNAAYRNYRYRSSPGGGTSSINTDPITTPYWLKLVRQGNTFNGYTSPDGATWTQIGAAVTINMSSSVYAGLAVTAEDNSALIGATFDNVVVSDAADFNLMAQPSSRTAPAGTASSYYWVYADALNGSTQNVNLAVGGLPAGATASFSSTSITVPDSSLLRIDTTSATAPGTYALTITGTSGALSHQVSITLIVSASGGTSLPAGWSAEDVGTGSMAGSASYSNGTFTVQGSGGIWNEADAFQFVYRSLSGDGAIIARLASTTTARDSKVGVMMRQTLSANSANVFVNIASWFSIRLYQYRPVAAASTTIIEAPPNIGTPYWLKLVRLGNTFSGYGSTDGINWVQLGATVTVNLPTSVFAGIAVTSGRADESITATLDNVQVSSGPFYLQPSQQVFGAGQPATVYVNVLNNFTGTVSLTASGLPAGATATFSPASVTAPGSSTLTITPAPGTAPGAYPFTVTGVSGSFSHSISLILTTNSAVFVTTDTTTQGTWKGVYGSSGYAIANHATSYPADAQVTFNGQSSSTWAASTTDVRALQKAAGSDRIASTWFSSSSFTIDINLTQGSHQVALYCLDWDTISRSQRIDVLDTITGTVIDSRSVSGFNGGKYLVWSLTGHVTMRVIFTGGGSAVVSGVFFDAAVAVSPKTATLTPSQTQQFTARLNGTPSGAVNWSLSPAVGTITAAGLYTAPSTISSSQNVTLTATSVADPTKAASASVTLTPLGWFNTSWTNRKRITIDPLKVPGAGLVSFPVLYSLTDLDLRTTANGGRVGKADGTDILFTAIDGTTKLNHEIESYNGSTGQLIAWFNMPSLSPGNSTLYVYFGNASAADQQNRPGVWDANYKGVWHLGSGSALSSSDSTANGYNGTNNGAVATTGQIGTAASFNGTNAYITNGAFPWSGGPVTVSFWDNTSSPVQSSSAFSIGNSDSPNRAQAHVPWSDSTLYWDYGDIPAGRVSTGYAPYVGQWTHVTLVSQGAGGALQAIYLNGSLAASATASQSPTSALTSVWIGRWLGFYHKGSMDEFRVSNVVRSADWIATEYNNQSAPSAFYTVGALETP